jgi:peptidoglycan/xylan/chitin deacetylase (PgdA/CDA1 family)
MRTLALLYHDVVPDGRYELSGFQSPDANIYKLEEGEFRRHLKTIAARIAGSAGSVLLPETGDRPRVLLTFDDGGASAHDISEMLDELGWTGHFFITTDYIGKPGFLDAEQVRGLRRRAHVIGSHSCSHPVPISRCTPEELDREWRDSVRKLQDILQEPVVTASVPGGFYARRVAESAARAGIRVLFTSEPVVSARRVEGCTVLGRFGVQQGVSEEWVGAVVEGRALPRLNRYLFWNGKKAAKAALGPVWFSMRKLILARRAGSGDAG